MAGSAEHALSKSIRAGVPDSSHKMLCGPKSPWTREGLLPFSRFRTSRTTIWAAFRTLKPDSAVMRSTTSGQEFPPPHERAVGNPVGTCAHLKSSRMQAK